MTPTTPVSETFVTQECHCPGHNVRQRGGKFLDDTDYATSPISETVAMQEYDHPDDNRTALIADTD